MKKITSILLVDDDLDDQFLFKMALKEVDDSVSFNSAHNGSEALTKLTSPEAVLPDLVFLDMNMPVMNGLTCLRELKKNEKLKDIPVIIFSTSSSLSSQKECLSLGAVFYIEKAPDYLLLHKQIEAALKGTYFKIELNDINC